MRLRGAGALRLAKSRPAGGCSHARSLRLAKRGETKFSPLLRIIPFPSKWEQAVKRLPEDLRHLLPQIRARCRAHKGPPAQVSAAQLPFINKKGLSNPEIFPQLCG